MRLLKQLRLILLRLVLGVLLIGLVIFLLFYYSRQIEPNLLLTTQNTVVIKDLPIQLHGLRIVQLSDLHGKEFADHRLIDKVNELKPDVLVITGDILDRYHQDLSLVKATLGPMQAAKGKFFVTGNNEYRGGPPAAELEQQLHLAGVEVLHNQSKKLAYNGSYIWLIGVDDPNTNHQDLPLALQGTDSAPKILLAHSPEIINEAVGDKLDLVLVGHTHGGQVRLPGLNQHPGAKARVERALEKLDYQLNRVNNYIWRHSNKRVNMPEADLAKAGSMLSYNMKPGFEKYLAGFYKVGDTQLYVNRGLGETRIPFRLFAPPEIAVFTLGGIDQ